MADTATPSRSRNDIRAGSRSYFDDEPGYKRMKKFSLLLLLMLGFRGVLCGQKFDLANGRVPGNLGRIAAAMKPCACAVPWAYVPSRAPP